MAKKITERTKLKVGDLVSYGTVDGRVVYQIAKIEKKRGISPCIALNRSPGDRYTRIHQSDLERHYQAEVISIIELVAGFLDLSTAFNFLKHKFSYEMKETKIRAGE